MGTEYWILKCPKFISHTEKQRLKIQRRFKNKNKNTKFRNIYEVHFKNKASLFFLQGYSEMKMKIKEQQRSNRGLSKKIRRKKEKNKIFFPN